MTLLFRVFFFIGSILLWTVKGYGQSLTLQDISPSVTDVLISSDLFSSARAAVVDVHEASGVTVYAWTEPDNSGSPTGNHNIYCAIYDKNMAVIQPAFLVNQNTTGDQFQPMIRIHQLDNTCIIGWASNHGSDGHYDVYAKKISLNIQNTATVATLTDNLINTNYTTLRQYNPKIAYDYTYDEVFIAWRDYDAQDGSGMGMYGRRLSNSNFPAFVDNQFLMNQTTTDHQIIYDIDISPVTGALYVLYSSTSASTGYDVYQRRFDRSSTGTYTAVNEVRLNTTTSGAQWNPSFKFNTTNGAYSAGWTSDGQDGSGRGVYFRVFDKNDASLLAETRASIPTLNNQFAVRSAWDEESGYLIHFYIYSLGTTVNLKYQLFDATYATYGSETDALSSLGLNYTDAVHWLVYNNANKRLYVNYTTYSSNADIGKVKARYFKFSHPTYAEPACSTDNTKNWTSQIIYDQNGNKVKEQRTYTDQLGRAIQVQAKDFENKNILTAATLYDQQGNAAIQTLPAPINSQCFGYKSDFITYQTGGSTYAPYTFNQFESYSSGTGYWNNPVVVASNTGLGLYYSTSNTAEPYVAVSAYPYTRTYYNNPIAGGVIRQSNAGEALKMGSGKEVKSFTAPILNELDHYMTLRNNHFVLGGSSQTSLAYQGTKTFSVDENGIASVSFQDKSGKQLAKALVNGSIATPVTANIAPADFYYYNYTNSTGSNVDLYITNPQDVLEAYNFTSSSTITLTLGSPVTVTNGHSIQIRSSGSFGINGVTSSTTFAGTISLFQNPSLPSAVDFYITPSASFSMTGNAGDKISIVNLDAGGGISYIGSKGSMHPSYTPTNGFYRLRILSTAFSQTYTYSSTNLSVNYNAYYSDLSYYFYDNAGRLVSEVAPNSLIPVAPNGINSISTTSPVYKTIYTYNTLNQEIAKNDLDAGLTNYVYRKDGQIRFSQNAKQALTGHFSFTNYDVAARVIETGEYDINQGVAVFQTHQAYAAGTTSQSVFSVLENTAIGGGFGTSCSCLTQKTSLFYDNNSGSFPNGSLPYTRTQKFVHGRLSKTNNDNNSTWYSYDELGRITWTVQTIAGLGTKTTDYQYDLNGNVLKTIYQDAHAERFEHRYTYDKNQRLKWVETKAGNGAASYQAEEKSTYYLHGPVKRRELAKDLQGIDYTYTIQGWLKAINSPQLDNTDPGKDNYSGVNSGFANDAFGLLLEYYNPSGNAAQLGEYGQYNRCDKGLNNSVYTVAGVSDRYDGTIKAMRWKTRGYDVGGNASQYVFEYDKKNQLKNATFGTVTRSTNNCTGGTDAYYVFTASATNAFKVSNINYDANGNLLNKYTTDQNGVYTLGDKFDYNYIFNTNRLSSVTKNGSSPAAYYNQYQYNALGQMRKETKENGKSYIWEYNVYELVTKVTDSSSTNKLVAEFFYNERGVRVKKKSYDASGSNPITTYYVTDLSHNVLSIYDDNDGGAHVMAQKELPIYGLSGRIGVATKTTVYSYTYELTDHLGNVRAIVKRQKVIGQGDIAVKTDYFPHGALMPGGFNSMSRNDYQGQFAEKDPETTYNSFELRNYDARTGRWLSPDPMEQYWSPYMAMGNNPVSTIDPTGGYGYQGGMGGGFSGGWGPSGYPVNYGLPSGYNGVGASYSRSDYYVSYKEVKGTSIKGSLIRFFTGNENYGKYLNGGYLVDKFEVTRYVAQYNYSGEGSNQAQGNGCCGGVGDKILDGVQLGLDVAGLVPGIGEFADGANALIYTGRGDYVNAALSTAAMIPFAGWAASGSKFALKGAKGVTKSLKFGGDEAVIHFGKHSDQIMKVTGKSVYNLKDYTDDANWIIQNGTYNSKLNGYYHYMGNAAKGESLFGFVGLKNGGSSISTFHIKTATQLGLK